MATDVRTPDLKCTKIPILKEGESDGVGLYASDHSRRRSSLLGRFTCAGILVLLSLVLCGTLCFLLQETRVLRVETERLKLRLRAVELQIQRCNAFLQDGEEGGAGWISRAEESSLQVSHARRSEALDSEEQRDEPASRRSSASSEPSSSSSSSLLSSSTSLEKSSSLSSSSSVLPWRRKRSPEHKAPKKVKEKQKAQKEFSFNFETEKPLVCKQTNCLSLVGWKPSSWVDVVHHRLYNDVSGQLEIPVAGVHYIYAQVTYETVSALEAFAIMVDSVQLGRCLTGVDYVNPALKAEDNAQRKTCHTGLAVHLRKGQKVWIKSLHMEGEPISVVSMKHSSFWGVVKIAPK